jgi:hypothetical protein
MENSTNKSKIISLLALYNLDYIVDFPTRMNAQSASAIDNIFLDRSQNKNYSIVLYFNITNFFHFILGVCILLRV